MFQFPRFASSDYEFTAGWRRITGAGFPHSEIRGSKAVQRLTAAYRSRPRPSSTPGAKASTVCPYYLDGETAHALEARGPLLLPILALCSFQGPPRRARRSASAGGLSKLSSVADARSIRRTRSTLGKCLPRKEVIQPQLPLRLPCYDFTPITSPTFDGSLPCGLGHRLRVLPAFVV